jgi:hypothetical protein
LTTSTPCFGAVLDVDSVEASTVGGDDQQVWHAREQLTPGMEARRKLVARRPDLVGVCGRHDRLRDLDGGVVLELVEPDLGPLCDDVEIAGMRDVAHVKHALDVVFHSSGSSMLKKAFMQRSAA